MAEKKCTSEIGCFCTDFNRHLCRQYKVVKEKKTSSFGKPKSKIKTNSKPTGEMEFFKKEWEKRGGKCFVTGDVITFSPLCCFHILGKGAFPNYRLNPDNLIFVKPQYHVDWHSMGRQRLLEKDSSWQKVFDMYDALKDGYENTKTRY